MVLRLLLILLLVRGAGEEWRISPEGSEEISEAGTRSGGSSGHARPDLALERGPIKRPERALQKLVRVYLPRLNLLRTLSILGDM